MARSISLNEAPSASTNLETRNHASGICLTAQFIAEAFVKQYYKILHRNPNNTHRFYKEESTLSRPDANGSIRSFTTIKKIAKQIKSSDIKHWDTILLDVNAHNTLGGSIIVGVLGFLRKDTIFKHFSHTFLLAPQTKGYYVHNDIFQFIDSSSLDIPICTAKAFLVLVKDECTSTKDEVGDKNQVLPVPPQPVQKMSADQPSRGFVFAFPTTPSSILSPKPKVVPHSAKTVLVKNLPPYVTRKTLTHAVKGFGSVKHRNIDIRRYKDGYGYAFVEFNQPKSACLAVEAGIIMVDDWECEVEAKRAQIEDL